jgi:hypothetical protein
MDLVGQWLPWCDRLASDKKHNLSLPTSQRAMTRCRLERGPTAPVWAVGGRGLENNEQFATQKILGYQATVSVKEGDGHERWLWRGRGSDMDPLRSLSSWELWPWKAWWLVALPSMTRANSFAWGLQRKQSTKFMAGGMLQLYKLPAGCRHLLPGRI